MRATHVVLVEVDTCRMALESASVLYCRLSGSVLLELFGSIPAFDPCPAEVRDYGG